ncbi:MAG: hypothetical protein ABSA57_02755 [Candidatus Acidiferrales bacterium]
MDSLAEPLPILCSRLEAIYDDISSPIGFAAFAPSRDAKGGMFSSRQRLGMQGEPPPAVVGENDL